MSKEKWHGKPRSQRSHPLINPSSDDLRFQNNLNMSATLVYVAASTNRFSDAADVSPSSSVIAFGSSRLLALWHADVSRALPNLYFGPQNFIRIQMTMEFRKHFQDTTDS
jgi:hypothetical protein